VKLLRADALPDAPPSAYWSWRHRLARWQHAERAVFEGTWLGFLDRAELHRLDVEFYERQTQYQDAAYNDGGLHAWESELVSRFVPRGAQVVVTGAGGGREVLALAAAGYDATGYECNSGMRSAANARSRRGPERIRAVERDTFPKLEHPTDAVLVGWGSYMLMAGRERRRRFLNDARVALNPGGVIIASFALQTETAAPYLRVVWRISSVIRRLRRASPTELGDVLAPNYMHMFSLDEIRGEFASAGLSVIDAGRCAGEELPYGWIVARCGLSEVVSTGLVLTERMQSRRTKV